MANEKPIVDPEVRAAQVYDLCMDEIRVANISNIEAEILLAMMIGAILNVAYHNDRDVIAALKRITEEAGHYYEKAKRIGQKQHDQERSVIKLDG